MQFRDDYIELISDLKSIFEKQDVLEKNDAIK